MPTTQKSSRLFESVSDRRWSSPRPATRATASGSTRRSRGPVCSRRGPSATTRHAEPGGKQTSYIAFKMSASPRRREPEKTSRRNFRVRTDPVPAQAAEIGVVADPEGQHVKITPRDKFLILASDGVWEYVSNRQAVRFVEASLRLNVNEPQRAELAAKYLVNVATKYWINEGGGYQDDISAMVIVLDPMPWKKKY